MNFTLERFCYGPLGTFGRLTNESGFSCFTVEEVWNNNAKSKSCIPEGSYVCRRGHFPKHGDAFEVTNVPNRTAILIHVANTIDDVEGCIGPGDYLGWYRAKWSVADSRAAYARFMRELDGINEFSLRITHFSANGT